MKTINHYLVVVVAFCLPLLSAAQDTIRSEHIKPFTYGFKIENGQFRGEGGNVLSNALAEAHVVMIGNNSRYLQEQKLSLGIVNELNKHNFKYLVKEIGSSTGEVLRTMTCLPSEIPDKFKEFNNEYGMFREGQLLTPIPDIKSEEAAKEIHFVKENNWDIVGVGPESWLSFKMLCTHMYNQLTDEQKKEHSILYQRTIELIDDLMENVEGQNNDDILALTSGLIDSEAYQSFIRTMSAYDQNKEIIDDMEFSMDYWNKYGNKKFYEKNLNNSQNNKAQLKRSLKKASFDFSKDKLCLMMWKGHLSKSVTPNGFYGVGDMLRSLTDYHGNKSLSITIFRRYSKDDGIESDVLNMDGYISKNYRAFLELGDRDHWVLIDLRPFNKEFFWGNYHLTIPILSLIRNFDMILIPPMDEAAKNNY